MARELIDELMEELQKMKENKMTFTPAEVIGRLILIAKEHRLTMEELNNAYGFREPTRDEFRQLAEQLREEQEKE